MSKTARKVCGEGLSLSLQDRDARVIGKSVSKSDYGAIRIGSVGTRMEKRLARAQEKYQHTLPRFVSRFFDTPKRSLWSSSYPAADLQYLLWNPSMEEEEPEVVEAPDIWMKSKKPWVGARVFRMPKSAPFVPMQASRTPKTAYARQETKRPRALARLRQKNADLKYQQSIENKALESLPPFLSSSRSVTKMMRQSHERQTNTFRPAGIGSQFLPPKIQNQMGANKQGFQQAKGRFRKDRPTGLRSLQLSSPMMQELMPLSNPQQDIPEEQEAVSPWFTREPQRSEKSTSSAKNQKRNTEKVQPSNRLRKAQVEEERIPSRSVITSLSRSLRREVSRARPSQRAAQNMNLGMKQGVQETPASVHALQRSVMNTERSDRSVLPIANIFSEQSRIGKSIARHQASRIRQKENRIGTGTAEKSKRKDLSAQKRKNVRRRQLFSIPELLDVQMAAAGKPVESVQEKAESPWFTRAPQTSMPAVSNTKREGIHNLPRVSRQTNPQKGYQSRSEDILAKNTRFPEKTLQESTVAEEPSAFSRRAQRVQDVDIFGFGTESKPTEKPVSASTYAQQRLSEEEGSSYQPIDQRVQERIEKRNASNKDRVARIEAPVSHQVRARRFVPTPDFVDIQEQRENEEISQQEQQASSPWFTRSPVVHASQRQEVPVSSNGSIIPKAISNKKSLSSLQRREDRDLLSRAPSSKRSMQRSEPTAVESALQRTPSPSAQNPSRPRIVRKTNTDEKVSLLRSAGLDTQGVALALAYAQGSGTKRQLIAQASGKQGWADVRFRRQSPVSYARSAKPETVVVQTAGEEQQEEVAETSAQSPWFTREPAKTTSTSQPQSKVEYSNDVDGVRMNPRATSTQQDGALHHMLARSTVRPSLPQEIAVGTKSRSIFSGQPTVRLSTMPSQYGLNQTVLSQRQASSLEDDVQQDQSEAGASSSWLSPKESSQEHRAANALIKRVAKLGVKAKVYKTPKGTMMDAKAAKALGFTPPKGKSRIPLTWVLEAVENKSNSGILPNWAQRSSEKPLHKGTSDMVSALNKASSMDQVLRVIFDRTSSKQVAPSFQSIPVHATQVLQHIRQEAHQLAAEQELQEAQMNSVSTEAVKSIQRKTQKVLSSFTGLKPMATAKVEAAGPNDDKLSKLTRKLQDLILVAEQQGKHEAQGGARLAEDSAQAIEEGRGEPKGIDESVSEELNLDQLYRDVLRSVEDAINLKRVLRFDNDDQFDGGW